MALGIQAHLHLGQVRACPLRPNGQHSVLPLARIATIVGDPVSLMTRRTRTSSISTMMTTKRMNLAFLVSRVCAEVPREHQQPNLITILEGLGQSVKLHQIHSMYQFLAVDPERIAPTSQRNVARQVTPRQRNQMARSCGLSTKRSCVVSLNIV